MNAPAKQHHRRRTDPAVLRAQERWQKGLAREQERNGYNPRDHRGSRA